MPFLFFGLFLFSFVFNSFLFSYFFSLFSFFYFVLFQTAAVVVDFTGSTLTLIHLFDSISVSLFVCVCVCVWREEGEESQSMLFLWKF